MANPCKCYVRNLRRASDDSNAASYLVFVARVDVNQLPVNAISTLLKILMQLRAQDATSDFVSALHLRVDIIIIPRENNASPAITRI